ncbi:uncharacterized protein LOC129247141 [Anastrepha obliqua]|uniref:uncharacterized protein LOC129247141 n=1 Tax=Anastrepha obliqua TaxID=95512 RepID=UPI00240945D1|nr:uncharacterized protein LOC129247141 [Anastrepha obliqua]
MRSSLKSKLKVDGEAFRHLKEVAFPKVSDAKLKGGILVGPQIRKLMRDEKFTSKLSAVERRAWESFKSLCEKFLGNKKSSDYVEVVKEFLSAYEKMECNMSIKIHFLHSHLNFFPENLGQMSDEQGERFHQEIGVIEKRFQGKNSINMLADYCWSLKRKTSDDSYKWSRSSKHF